MRDHIIDSIDSALHDWDVSADAMRSVPPEAKERRRTTPVELNPQQLAVVNDSLTEAWREIRRQFVELERVVGRVANAVAQADATAQPAEPPTDDVRERALWLRQNRNTGPRADPPWRRR